MCCLLFLSMEGSPFIGSASSDRICPALRSVQREKDYGKSLKFLHITPSDPHKTSNNGFRITLCPPLLRIKILILNLCLSPYLLYGCETDFSEIEFLAKKAVYSSVFKGKTSEVFTSKLLSCGRAHKKRDSLNSWLTNLA